MTLLSKEDRADELLEETIPELQAAGDGEELESAYQELLSLSRELVEEHNRYSWQDVPDQCRARLYELRALKSEATPAETVSRGTDTNTAGENTQIVEAEDYDEIEHNETHAANEENGDNEDMGTVQSNSELYEIIEPEVTFEDIIGLKDVKEEFEKMVELPLKHPEKVEEMGLDDTPNGLLLYGPPGCGKTMICEATANKTDATVIKVRGSDVVSKYVGQPQQNVAELFQEAKEHAPVIIVFDEIDALLSARGEDTNPTGHDQMVSEFLTHMSELGLNDQVFLVGTTNMQGKLDDAATRSGRIDGELYVPAPNESERTEFIRTWLKSSPNEISPKLVKLVAQRTKWYAFADLHSMLNKAGIDILYEGEELITNEAFIRAFQDTCASPDAERWGEKQEHSGHWG